MYVICLLLSAWGYSYPTNFLQLNKYFNFIVIQCLIFVVFYIATFDITFITMFILYYNTDHYM